ncbi:SDR family oxidoreductase [Rossellomorea aquimaris]|uniref:SDR family oxidoreductase n=1 Tax=Rossellomorea aquimaris TaxID=189382 RepID=UPI0007D0A539|nr:SDR family oxidoreductase [Rossellomorea aquimaris]
MKNGVYFITGFPGFLSINLLEELIIQGKAGTVYLLHLPSLTSQANEALITLGKRINLQETNIILVEGDITKSDLGLSKDILEEVCEDVQYVFHLAAIYDLAVPKDLAYNVNVEGTRNVNEFCEKVTQLKRYVYFSTAFVAGKRKGEIVESDLIEPEEFNNYYEQTKYEAEVLVEQVKGDLPTTIIRPGIVKGHSETGETIKFDGPYFIMNMFQRLSFLPWIPYLGSGEAFINIVPVEYVVQGTIFLGHSPKGIGKTYHLTDPQPIKVREVYDQILWNMYKRHPKGKIPLFFSNWALQFKYVRKYLKVEREALDYFTLDSTFNCNQAQEDLVGSSISCPTLSSQLPKMVEFYNKNSSNEKLHVKIN